jgi:flagellar basal body-associated protein FliL
MISEMFQPFESMFSMFWIFFVLVFVIIVASIVLTFWKMIKSGKIQDQTSSEAQPIVKEKEIIREVVKIRCSYCGNLYDENLDKCPYCGGGKSQDCV